MEINVQKIIEKIFFAIGNEVGKLFKKQYFGEKAVNLYKKYWNPVNYAIIGGIGVGINYLVFSVFINMFAWWFTDMFAIASAWLWNWSMSVGPLGYMWGFKTKPSIKSKCTHSPELFCKDCIPKGMIAKKVEEAEK